MKKMNSIISLLSISIILIMGGCTGNTASNTDVELNVANTELSILRRANDCVLSTADSFELNALLADGADAADEFLKGKGC